MHRPAFLVPLLLCAAACGGGSDNPCADITGPCVAIEPGPDARAEAQTALIEAQPGDTVLFLAGRYELDRDLSLDVDSVTIRGQGMDRTVLSFTGQTEGAQGILVTSDDFHIEDLAIEDTPGDGLKVEGSQGVFIRRVRVEWTTPESEKNGAYGLYPVQCKDVLIEDSVVRGASDAGIYVGQSENIIVRKNRAEKNVAGIEIENSSGADVYSNIATQNTGGLLVFNLPELQVKNGKRTRVFGNTITDNNTPNFAAEGNIVASVPSGTGMVLLAAHQLEIFDNDIGGNKSANIGIPSYNITGLAYDDAAYDPDSDTIDIHDNRFTVGGDDYDKQSELAALVAIALYEIMEEPIKVPDVVFFGYVSPSKADATDPRKFQPEFNLCLRNNGAATFVNLDLQNNHTMVTTDPAPHDCAHTPLAEITISGVE